MSFFNSVYDEDHLHFSNRINPTKSHLRIIATKYIKTDMIYYQNHQNLIFVEISTVTEYSTHCQIFFPSLEYDEKHFYFLNHVNPIQIEENIGPSDPPYKTPKNRGV